MSNTPSNNTPSISSMRSVAERMLVRDDVGKPTTDGRLATVLSMFIDMTHHLERHARLHAETFGKALPEISARLGSLEAGAAVAPAAPAGAPPVDDAGASTTANASQAASALGADAPIVPGRVKVVADPDGELTGMTPQQAADYVMGGVNPATGGGPGIPGVG